MSSGRVRVRGGGPELRGGSQPLSDLLARAGLPLNTRCGRRGLCKGCLVELASGSLELAGGAEIRAPAEVRSCQAMVPREGVAEITIPTRSLLTPPAQIAESFLLDVPWTFDPMVPAVQPGDVVCAVDLGTTTVAALLMDLHSGSVLARAGAANAQARFGDNVLTRIAAASEALAAMQAAAVAETLAPLLERLFATAPPGTGRLRAMAVSGNTTMLHILAGVDPSPLGKAPFTPRFLDTQHLTASELGLPGGPGGGDYPVILLPGLSAYVGADIASGMLATGLIYDEAPALLVDLGTNGEIVLQVNGHIFGCATAAGPAFEGSGLVSGVRAGRGAIASLELALHPFRIQ
ncbi:MAG: ASKHA domain-containing protein, partial [Terrimicrobiaceae bacterium]|nr:ASKHA domain-containing protein [Terrimicrobiaceae bacterium]